MENIRDQFLLDKNVIFLNHGSFGATPLPVFQEYQNWQLRLERQPVLFLGREYDELLMESRRVLGNYLNIDGADLVYIPNATHGVNIVARSLNLLPGDEVLTTDHEYGACDYTWNLVCKKRNAKYIHQPITLPLLTDEEIANQFWNGVTPRTKVIFLSHITSPTAIKLPIEKICERARKNGILTIIDGAHALGQVELDLKLTNADFYTSNCHKWSLAPKGSAFLYARKDVQSFLEPLVVSWGYGNVPAKGSGSQFIDYFQWTGTRDPAAALSVPAALKFMEDNQWGTVRRECHELLWKGIERINYLTGMNPIYPLDSEFYIQMGVAPLPKLTNLEVLKRRMYDEFGIEVPLTQLAEQKFVRISVQGYNTESDIDELVRSLEILLPQTIISG